MANITVDFAEESGSPTGESYDDEGVFSATRIFRCAWADRLTLAEQLRGYTAGIYTSVAAYPGIPEARVRTIGITPGTELITNDPTAGQLPTYEHALLTVGYSTRAAGTEGETQDPSDGAVIEESLEGSAEYLTIPYKGLCWDSPTGPKLGVEEAPALLIRMLSWNIAIRNVAHNTPNLNQYFGCVNHAPVTSISLDEQFPTGTVLFNSVSKQRQTSIINSSLRWSYVYNFLIRPYDWNTWYRSAESAPEAIYRSGGGRYILYPYINFVSTIRVRMN